MYAVPTCGSPVGDGATRTRTGPREPLSATGHDAVRQGADLLDGDADLVTDGEGADARRGAGEDDVTGQQCHRHTDVRHELVDAAHHLRRAAGLLELTVDRRRDRQVGGVDVGADPRPERAEG